MRPEDLGKIDTFKQEETAILTSAIEALQAGQCQNAHDWAAVRNPSQSFWLKRDRKRRLVWSLVEAAAHLGCLIADAPTSLKAAYTLRDALDLYPQSGHRIDNAHRHLEQNRLYPAGSPRPLHPVRSSRRQRPPTPRTKTPQAARHHPALLHPAAIGPRQVASPPSPVGRHPSRRIHRPV